MGSALIVLALLFNGPAAQTEVAEVGGVVATRPQLGPRPPALPITVNVYQGRRPVTSVVTDASGKFSVSAPPGDYWFQFNLGNEEVWVERVLMPAGSWRRDFDLDVWLPAQTPPPSTVAGAPGGSQSNHES